jgi:hypothetical protein
MQDDVKRSGRNILLHHDTEITAWVAQRDEIL